MGHIEVTPEAGRRFFSTQLDEPIVMLNLLRFREEADYSSAPNLAPTSPISGREAYKTYVREVQPLLAEAGSELLSRGRAHPALIGPTDEVWDEMLLVRHASRGAFLSFARSEAYLARAPHRTAALLDSRLIPIELAIS